MRGENEMLDLIISTARTDTRVLAAYLKGSRANPNAPKDIYRDFDVMYVATETCSFIRDTSWMNASAYAPNMTRAIPGCCSSTTAIAST